MGAILELVPEKKEKIPRLHPDVSVLPMLAEGDTVSFDLANAKARAGILGLVVKEGDTVSLHINGVEASRVKASQSILLTNCTVTLKVHKDF